MFKITNHNPFNENVFNRPRTQKETLSKLDAKLRSSTKLEGLSRLIKSNKQSKTNNGSPGQVNIRKALLSQRDPVIVRNSDSLKSLKPKKNNNIYQLNTTR